MDLLPYLNNAVECLAGAIGIEQVNPTCIAYGFPSTGFLQQFLSWSPVVGFISVIFGVPLVVYLIHKVFDVMGIDFL